MAGWENCVKARVSGVCVFESYVETLFIHLCTYGSVWVKSEM